MKTKFQIHKILPLTIWLFIIGFTGCKKLVEAPAPVTSVNSENVYTNDATAIAVLTGFYAQISNGNFTGGTPISLSFLSGLSADELTLYNPTSSTVYNAYYTNALSVNTAGFEFWQQFYPLVFQANAAIEGLSASNGLTPAVKQQLTGEAKFMRAFFYFYLVNLYGDVPLAISSDYKINSLLARMPQAQVYQQIIKDLTDAESLLSNNYLDISLLKTTSARVRPTKWAAEALLARAYLYTKDYANAEKEATLVIGNSAQFSLPALKAVFLANSSEAIWQLQPVNVGYNTPDAMVFTLPSSGPNDSNPVYLSSNLLSSFEANDRRMTVWVASVTPDPGTTCYYPAKYQANNIDPSVFPSEFEMVLRLGEQYLIRAEARAQLGETSAIDDLNAIRNRAGLLNYSGGASNLLAAIRHERQVELFTEWGHRWLDLKRTGIVDAVMTTVTSQKGSTWNTNQQLYPLPTQDLQNDHNLKQNSGY